MTDDRNLVERLRRDSFVLKQKRDPLVMWVIYEQPMDADGFVARKWLCTEQVTPTTETIVRPTLDKLRAALPPGLVRLHRAPTDDPVIVKVWL